MLNFFGGVPELLVPDNLKAAVTKADRYSPTINETYAELACHYQTAVLPARPYKPKDKAKAETSVLLVERWILARLRHQTFFSLAELNTAIAALLPALTSARSKAGSRAVKACTTRLTVQPCDRSQQRPIPTPSGARLDRALIITLR
jgi:transposase